MKCIEAIEVIAIMFSVMILFYGATWCERTGRIDVMLVGVVLMLIAAGCEVLKKWKT